MSLSRPPFLLPGGSSIRPGGSLARYLPLVTPSPAAPRQARAAHAQARTKSRPVIAAPAADRRPAGGRPGGLLFVLVVAALAAAGAGVMPAEWVRRRRAR